LKDCVIGLKPILSLTAAGNGAHKGWLVYHRRTTWLVLFMDVGIAQGTTLVFGFVALAPALFGHRIQTPFCAMNIPPKD
jgi:hypothetical protein